MVNSYDIYEFDGYKGHVKRGFCEYNKYKDPFYYACSGVIVVGIIISGIIISVLIINENLNESF